MPFVTRWMMCLPVLLPFAILSSCSYLSPEKAKQKYLTQGDESFKQGKFKDAEIAYRRALRKDARFGEAHLRRARALLGLGNLSGAVSSFQRAAALMPANLEARAQLADLYLSAYWGDRNRPKQILDMLTNLHKQMEGIAANDFATLRLGGNLALAQGDRRKAIDLLAKANALKPDDPGLAGLLAQTMMTENRGKEAEQLALKTLEKQPAAGRLYDLLYFYYRGNKRDADAESLLKTKIAKNPKAAGYRVQLAMHYLSLNRRADADAALQQILDDPASFPLGQLSVGSFRAQIGDTAGALRLFEAGAKAGPADKLVYQKAIIGLLMIERRTGEAEKLVDEVLKEKPKDVEVRSVKGVLELDRVTPDSVTAALGLFQELVKELPWNPGYRFGLARAYLLKGELQEAEKELRETVRRRNDFIPARVTLTELLMESGRFKEARQQADEMLKLSPQMPRARLLRVQAEMGQGNLAGARLELNQLLRDYPKSGEALVQAAILDIMEGKQSQAEPALRRLYTPGRGDVRTLRAMVALYASRNQWDKAIEVVQADLRQNPPYAVEAHKALGELYTAAGRPDEAIEQYLQALPGDLRAADTYYRLSALYFSKRDDQTAVNYLQKAKERAPRNAQVLLALGSLLERTGRMKEAQEYFRQVLSIDAENAAAMNNLAYNLAESGGNLEEASQLARRAVDKMPDQASFSDTLGTIYLRRNLPDVALKVFQDVVQKQPDNPTFRLHLAETLLRKGDKASAKRELDAALARKPSKADEERIRALMGKVG